MTYENDPILPLIQSEIRSKLEPLTKLTPEEENKMFALDAAQKKQVAENDHRAKFSYLSNPPNIASGSVKNTDVYKNITQRMKRRIESTFKL
jgi:hypothetical protein